MVHKPFQGQINSYHSLRPTGKQSSFNGLLSDVSHFNIDDMFTEAELKSFAEIYGRRSKRRSSGGSLLIDPLKARLAKDKFVCRSIGIEEPTLNLEYIEMLLIEVRRFGNANNLDLRILEKSRNYFLQMQEINDN